MSIDASFVAAAATDKGMQLFTGLTTSDELYLNFCTKVGVAQTSSGAQN